MKDNAGQPLNYGSCLDTMPRSESEEDAVLLQEMKILRLDEGKGHESVL